MAPVSNELLYKEAFEASEGVRHFMTLPREYWDDNWKSQDKYDVAKVRLQKAEQMVKEIPSGEPMVPWSVVKEYLAADSFYDHAENVSHPNSDMMERAARNQRIAYKKLQSYSPDNIGKKE